MQTQMIKNTLISIALVSFFACSSSIPEVENNKKSSNVATTEKDGVVTAEIDANAKSDQTVVASSNSAVADASVSFPPGSLAISTSIALGEATDSGSAFITELGLSAAVVKAAAPVFIGVAAGDMPVTGQSIALSLPLPMSESAVKLTTATGKLVFFYAIFTAEGWKSGVKPLTSTDLVGTFLQTKILGLGYFQVAYLTTSVEAKEMTTAIRPALKKQ